MQRENSSSPELMPERVVNETICAPLYSTAMEPAYLAVTLPALVSPVICIVLICCFVVRFYEKGCFHPNYKILLFCQLSFTTMYCSVFLYTHGYQLLYSVLYTRDDMCALIHYAVDCVAVYYVLVISITGMVAIQVCIGIERIVSTIWIRSYESSNTVLGISLASGALTLAIAVSIVVHYDVDYYEVRLTCMGVPATAGNKAWLLYYTIIVLDLITAGLFLFSLKLNKDLGKGHSAYVLGVKYQRTENANVIRMLLPNVIAHCLVYCTFAASATFIRSHHELFSNLVYNVIAVVINLVPHYTVIELTILHIVLTKMSAKNQEFIKKVGQHNKVNERDLYFEGYLNAWK